MAFINPSDSTEVLYGSSGDVRDELNAYLRTNSPGHVADEAEIPGTLIVASIRRATRLINSFLAPVYADNIPVTTVAAVPKFLDEAASDIGMFFVWRSAHVLLGKMPDDKKLNYYDQYVSTNPMSPGFLVLISQSKMQLPEFAGVLPNEADDIRQQSRPAIFDLDDIKEQEVSPGLLDEISEDRESDS